jgi:omega-6 fatty acid desaturase (delta-12 desaturase)
MNKVNESELFMKYKSSYKSAFLDLSLHTFLFSSSLYLLWLFRNSWLNIFTIPLLGLILHRNYVVFHDCVHNSYTPNKTLNNFISHFLGILVFTSPNWIVNHKTHHLTNGHIENDHHYLRCVGFFRTL